MNNLNQDKFLKDLVESKQKIFVYLVTGIKLVGEIVSFDEFTIQLVNEKSSQLIYKQAISTILPS